MSEIAIDDELATFLAGGNSMVVGTRNAALEPNATRASAIRVIDANRIVVSLPKATSVQARTNLEQNGEIAVCASFPRTFRSVQLKGRCIRIGECSAEDVVACEQQALAFSDAVQPFGYGRAAARNLWLFDCFSVEMRVTAVFEQTPGPGAGAPRGVRDAR